MTTLKRIALELVFYVVGYITITVVTIVGRMTVRLGRAVFSR